ncbi:M48 family metallopeptidase [Rhizobium sp. LjRoot254]|uniref:M48 family metallopeptidase n=1 Tax=Rhizobium sp. LjRoot254 TaxID=3342297 RepID=UPI003ECFC257
MASDGVEIAGGTWHPPKSNAAIAATLLADGARLSIRLDGDGSIAYRDELQSVKISDRIGSIPRRIMLHNDSTFETHDNDAIDGLLKAHRSDRTGWISELEQFRPRLIGFVVLVFLLATLIYRYALPALVEVAVLVTPPAVPGWLSQGTLASLDQTMLSASKLPLAEQQKIRAGFDEIAGFSTRGKAGYNLNFRDGGFIGPNAFALPDGSLVITDALVEMAKGDMEMILGVLAHEIGHVEKNHSLRQMYRAAGLAGLIMLIAGDVGSGGEEVLTDGAALLSLSYSRGAESEADRISVELMSKAGHDPAAIGRFFKLLEERLGDKGGTSMLSTHPGTPERRKQIDEWAKEVGGQ